MKSILCIVVVVVLSSCKKEKPTIVDLVKETVNAVIIVDNQMDSIPVVIRDMPSFENSDSNISIINTGVDTLIWKKNSDDIVRISSRVNKLQNLLLRPSDTLHVRFQDSVITLEGTVIDWDSFQAIETLEIDSVQQLRDQLHS